MAVPAENPVIPSSEEHKPPREPLARKTSELIYSYTATKRFRDATTNDTEKPSSSSSPSHHTLSLDFDDSGEFLLTSRSDSTLQIYSATSGKHTNTLFSQKYGCHLARFTHTPTTCIYASTKNDHAIRHLSTHDNAYINYFAGHTGQVTDIALSPRSDAFVSCGEDNTVRYWDLHTPHARFQLQMETPYLCAYDPTGFVVAIASPSTSSIILYDSRYLDQIPFHAFDLAPIEAQHIPHDNTHLNWSGLEFANDGKSILLSTTGTGHYLLDAFDGELKGFLSRPNYPHPAKASLSATRRNPPGYVSDTSRPLGQTDACFTSDGRFVVSSTGSEDPNSGLAIYDTDPSVLTTPNQLIMPTHVLAGHGQAGRVDLVACNPRWHLIATAERDVVFWGADEETARRE
ncbi:MAG: member of Set1p complex, histone methyl transferase [Cirrosporium novae-zelandiae]|nr:MAG: member of Set1p complex, histone methyl transferase [Cirrosporium novae-zelandiae]